MKTKLPYFLPALLSCSCLFYGPVRATLYTEEYNSHLISFFSLFDVPLNGILHFIDEAFRATFHQAQAGGEEVRIGAELVGGDDFLCSLTAKTLCEEKTIPLLPSVGSLGLAGEIAGLTGSCYAFFFSTWRA